MMKGQTMKGQTMKLRNMNAYVTEENITIALANGEVLDLENALVLFGNVECSRLCALTHRVVTW